MRELAPIANSINTVLLPMLWATNVYAKVISVMSIYEEDAIHGTPKQLCLVIVS